MLAKLKKTDLGIVSILLLFMAISTFIVRSATHGNPDYYLYDVKTVIFYVLGFIILLAGVLFDYKIIVKISPYIYVIGILSLVAVYFFGKEINGAKGWFKLPGNFLLQPAELMKLCLIITVAFFLNRRNGEALRLFKDVVPIGLSALLPFLLVFIQPDLGNAIIYVVIVLGMFWIGNIKFVHVLMGLVIAGLMLASFLFLFNAYNEQIKDYLDGKGKVHWYQRINTFIDPDKASYNERYQVDHSMIAIGSGSLTGDGYMKGDSKNQKFIPYAYSDSIFVVIGEEFGFIGSSVVLLLYFLLIYRMILISIQCTDTTGSYIIIGVVSMFVFQIFENIGMLIGIMPLTGITLPFISYGGSSLMINMMCIGLVLSIKVHQVKHPVY